MNNKNLGEIGERISIGELAKFNLDILLPLSDNLPFDFVVFTNNKMYKCQVKTSTKYVGLDKGSLEFDLTSNNWNTGKIKFYSEDEVDVFILCDLNSIYLFSFKELENRKSITLRKEPSKNNQLKGINFSKDFIVTEDRIKKVFK